MSQPDSLTPLPEEIREAINEFRVRSIKWGSESSGLMEQKELIAARTVLDLAIRRAMAGAGQPTLPKEPSREATMAAFTVRHRYWTKMDGDRPLHETRAVLRAAYAVDAATSELPKAMLAQIVNATAD